MHAHSSDNASLTDFTRRELLTRAVAGGALLSLGSLPARALAASAAGGTLRVGTTAVIDVLNPYAMQAGLSYIVMTLIYPSLVGWDSHGNLTPDLAASWSTSADGRTITFKIRSGGKWSDGQPLTAADAAWTINTVVKFQKDATAEQAGTVQNVVSASAPRPDVLTVKYSKPTATALATLVSLRILPQHIWSTYAQGSGAGLKTFSNLQNPVTGGPFTVAKLELKQIALLQRATDFYGTAPKADAIGFQYFGTPDALILALTNGEIDATDILDASPALARLTSRGYIVDSYEGYGFDYLAINSNPKKPKNRELLSPKVRLALAHAIDREKIVQTIYFGRAAAAGSIISPAAHEWHDPSIRPEAFDIDAGNRILDSLGYKRGSDGIRRADGHRMDYVVITPSEVPSSIREFGIIRDGFAKLGIRVTPKALDPAAHFSAVAGKDNTYLNFDFHMWPWNMQPDPYRNLLVLTKQQWGGLNDSGYANPAFDRLYNQQAATIKRAARRKLIFAAQRIVYREKPYIPLTYLFEITAHTKRWTGFQHLPSGVWDSTSKGTGLTVRQTG